MRDKPRPANAPMAFLADIHGNVTALDAVLAELRRRMITQIYVAGDLLLGGPDPVEVFKRLQQVDARCTRGLADSALVELSPDRLAPATEEERAMAERFAATRDAIGELALMFLQRLPERLRIPMMDGSEIVMVHGSPLDPATEISHDVDDDELLHLLGGDPADIVVCGASHVAFQREIEGVRVINVGSVGASPEGGLAHFTVITPRVDGALVEQTWVEWE
ncbi:MAG: metallophosphoesterase family protein [Sandaracinaceae bacterium]|nr:metallophosphoesterase family protein [Sandaracinaceae bacterium]